MTEIHFECPKCSQSIDAPHEMASQLVDCPTCKETIEVPARTQAPPQAPPAPKPRTNDGETVFFQSNDITVTNARFIVGAQTFAMRGITSVQGIRRSPSYGGPVVLIVVGMLFLFPMGNGIQEKDTRSVVGFGLLAFILSITGILWSVWKKPTFEVVLRTSGGEVVAYSSLSQSYVSEIINALNQSIVSGAA
jgi:hypothetical protein